MSTDRHGYVFHHPTLRRQNSRAEFFLCRKCNMEIVQMSQLVNRPSQLATRQRFDTFGQKSDVLVQQFENPLGMSFEVIGAKEANACRISEETSGDTWYPGFNWKILGCPRCGTHIGWEYLPADVCNYRQSPFFGMVLSSLSYENVSNYRATSVTPMPTYALEPIHMHGSESINLVTTFPSSNERNWTLSATQHETISKPKSATGRPPSLTQYERTPRQRERSALNISRGKYTETKRKESISTLQPKKSISGQSSSSSLSTCKSNQRPLREYELTHQQDEGSPRYSYSGKDKATRYHLPRSTSRQAFSDVQSIQSVKTSQLKNWGMTRVTASFQNGMTGITLLVDSILPLIKSAASREIQYIGPSLRQYSAQAYTNMRDAQVKSEVLSKELNNRMEGLVDEKSQKERDVAQKEMKRSQLKAQMAELLEQLKNLEEDFNEANAEYQRADEFLISAEKELADKICTRDRVDDIGTKLLIVPVAGWIVGGAMLAVKSNFLDRDVEAAKEKRDLARQFMETLKRRVEEKKSEISDCENEIQRNKSEKDTINSRIEGLESNIADLQGQYKHQCCVSENLRKCVTLISITADRTEVLHDQVKFLYNPATIVGPLKELVAHLSQPEMGVLQTNNPKVVEAFESKLKMIVVADDRSKQENVLDFKKESVASSLSSESSVEMAATEDHKVPMTSDNRELPLQCVEATTSVVDRMYTDESIKKDRKIILSQYAGWEEFLIPAPMLIAFLGELMLLSTQKDFPLDERPPIGGFRHLKRPKSFRATVLQVANAGWVALNTANTNMDQIRVYTNTLPLHLSSGFDILSNALHEDVEQRLPLCLFSVKNVAKKCHKRAKSTHEEFVKVFDMIAELQEASVSAKGPSEKQRKYVQVNLNTAADLMKDIREDKDALVKQKEDIKQSIEKAEKWFDEAIKTLPNGWNRLGMAVVEGIADVTSAVFSNASIPYQTAKGEQKRGPDQLDDSVEDIDVPTKQAYTKSNELQVIANKLSYTFVEGETLNMSEVSNSSEMMACKGQVQRIIKTLQRNKACEVNEKVLELAKHTSSLCKILEKIKDCISESTKEELGGVAKDIIDLQNEVSALAKKGQSLMAARSRLRPPNIKASQSCDESDTRAANSGINKAKEKTERACQLLKHAQQNYSKNSKDLTDASKRMSEVLAEMAGLELEKLDFKVTIDILHRGIVALGSIRKQWGKIVHFFHTILSIVDCSLNLSLKNFLAISDKAQKSALEGYTLSRLKREMLYQPIMQASELAWFVSMIAESYSEISANYLMPRVARLPRLLSCDHGKETAAIQLEISNLHTECYDAQREIECLLLQKKREFDRTVDQRQKNLRTSIDGAEGKTSLTGSKTRAIARETIDTLAISAEDLV